MYTLYKSSHGTGLHWAGDRKLSGFTFDRKLSGFTFIPIRTQNGMYRQRSLGDLWKNVFP
jgi:hypothetical protein